MPAKTGRRKLTIKQKRFVKAYTGETKGNGTEAAKKAGYSEKVAHVQACENLKKPNVAAAIAAIDPTRDIASPEEIKKFLTDTMRGALDGAETRDRLRGAEVLTKVHGMQLQRHEVTGAGGGPLQFVMVLTVQERLERIHELLGALRERVAQKENDPA